VENNVFERLQEKVCNSKMMEQKPASLANTVGGGILGFAVVCFIFISPSL